MNYFFNVSMSVLLFACVSFSVHADTTKTPQDIEKELATVNNTSEARLPLLVEMVKQCWRKCPDKAEFYGNQALLAFESEPNFQLEAEMLVFMQRIYIDRGDHETTKSLLKRGIEAATKAKDDTNLSYILFNQAIYYYINDKLILALETYRQLEQTYKRTEDLQALGNLYNNIGNVYKKLGNLGSALEHYQLALPLVKTHSKQSDYANTLMNIGEVYHLLEDYQQALDNTLSGMAQLKKESTPLHQVEGNIRLGRIYLALQQPDVASTHFDNALSIAIKHTYQTRILTIYFDKILLALETGQVDDAQQALTASTEWLSDSLPQVYASAHNFYAAKIAVYNQNWQEAELLLQPIIDAGDFDQRFYSSIDAINVILQVKEKLGKLEEANKLVKTILEQYQANEEANRQSQTQQLAELYKTSVKEREIAELKEKSARQELQVLIEKQEKKQLIYIQLCVAGAFLLLLVLGYQRRKALKKEAHLTAQLMEDKKQFFADISHELRTPLTVFKLKLNKLQSGMTTNPEREYQRLHNRLDQFTCLVNDISLLAQSDQGELALSFTEEPLAPLLEGFAEELALIAGDHQLEHHIEFALPENTFITIDKLRFGQVMHNLFSNSCRYTDAPGSIHLNAQVSNNKLIISIEDSAPGLSQEALTQLFERLYRVDKSRSKALGGSGLGLSICRDLVKHHHGEITASNSKLGGVKIMISLPLMQTT
ncbi:ATP-binding protein [Pseudoalteromonas piratica]|uniref:ATP-binding protein n=1 Tax=Pseudoalteromonas piratica TaxID=1348114 RepID=UPI000690C20C|nr:ATP-binding protein [Pseudoalteromonas piratica]